MEVWTQATRGHRYPGFPHKPVTSHNLASSLLPPSQNPTLPGKSELGIHLGLQPVRGEFQGAEGQLVFCHLERSSQLWPSPVLPKPYLNTDAQCHVWSSLSMSTHNTSSTVFQHLPIQNFSLGPISSPNPTGLHQQPYCQIPSDHNSTPSPKPTPTPSSPHAHSFPHPHSHSQCCHLTHPKPDQKLSPLCMEKL